MGYADDLAGQAIRITLGPEVTREQVLRFADAWGRDYKRIRSRVA
jgi:cysteine desulfurase